MRAAVIMTDRLRSYDAAKRRVLPTSIIDKAAI
jgi:hypothetical protein